MKRVLYISHKPIDPIVDGGTQAMSLFFDVLNRCSTAEITYAPIITPRHPLFNLPASRHDLQVLPLKISTRLTFKKFCGIFSETPLNVLRYDDKTVRKNLDDLISGQCFDVIICDGFYALCLLNTLNLKQRIIYRSHNLESNYWKYKTDYAPWWKRPFYAWIARKMKPYEKTKVASVTTVLSISNDEITTLKAFNPQTTLFLPHVSVMKEAERTTESNYSIGFVGDMNWQPNRWAMDRFVSKVWPRFYDHFPALHLSIAGRGSESFTNTDRGIKGLGFVEDLNGFMSQQRFLINPVIYGTGFNIKLLDALIYHKPVVAYRSRLCGLEHLSCFISSESDDEFLNHMCRLASSDQLIKEVILNISKDVKVYFNVQDRISQLETLFYGT